MYSVDCRSLPVVGGTDPLGSLLQVITYVIILALCRPALRVNNPRVYDLANHKSVILLAVLLTDQQKTLLNQKVIFSEFQFSCIFDISQNDFLKS